MINDSVFQMHLFWPVFLAAFVPLSNRQGIAMALLALSELSHPVGILLCGMTAGAAFLIGSFGPPDQRPARFGWGFYHYLLAWAGIAKLLLWPDPYAAREATTGALLNTLTGVVGFPIIGIIGAWIAAWYLVRRARNDADSAPHSSGRGILFVLVVIGALWTVWAAVPAFWQAALNNRRWVAPFSLPFLAAALFEIWRARPLLARELAVRFRLCSVIATRLLCPFSVRNLSLWSPSLPPPHRPGPRLAGDHGSPKHNSPGPKAPPWIIGASTPRSSPSRGVSRGSCSGPGRPKLPPTQIPPIWR